MAKIESGVLQTLSILVGVMVGGILAYFYNTIVGLPMVISSEIDVWNVVPVWNMLIFLTIPALAGFIAGLIDKSKAMENGLLSGLFSGAINIGISIYLLIVPSRQEELIYDSGAFTFFIIMSVFLWVIIGATAGRLAKEYPR